MKILFIAVSITAILAAVIPIVIGTKTFDGVVTEKPYETGLLWDEIQKEKAESGWTVAVKNKDFHIGRNEIFIFVNNKNEKALLNPSVSVKVSRPSVMDYDENYTTDKMQEGVYKAVINIPLYGYWDLKINVMQGEKNIAFEQRIFAKGTEK
jgi:nitrogen fixation protein FixH